MMSEILFWRMSFVRRFIVNSLFFLMVSAVNAQTIREQYAFRHLAEQNGLSYNLVNCIIKDHNGFFWIGTYDGLNRFDGFHFTVYKNDRHNSNTLINNTVHTICEDKSGNIWT